MNGFEKIIIRLRTDDSEVDPALLKATQIARNSGARLTLVSTIAERTLKRASALSLDWDHVDAMTSEMDKRLEKIAVSIRRDGLEVDTNVLVGSSAEALVGEVLEKGYDLVLMTAKPSRADSEVGFGSTEMRLMRKCPCPVWLVRPSPEAQAKKILVAVDPWTEHEAADLNKKILDSALALGEFEGAPVHVLHTWEAFGENLMRSRLSTGEARQLVDAAKAEARSRFESILRPYAKRLAEDQIHLKKGEPARLIPVFARENAVDLIVMGSVARTGLAGFIMGNTAERILQRVGCSVMTIKPDAFESPVSPSDC